MATESKEVTHHKVFELSVFKYSPPADKHPSIRVDLKPIGVFDDKEKLDAFIASKGMEVSTAMDIPAVMPTKTFCYVREEWMTSQPTQESFNLPFNPTADEVQDEPVPEEVTTPAE